MKHARPSPPRTEGGETRAKGRRAGWRERETDEPVRRRRDRHAGGDGGKVSFTKRSKKRERGIFSERNRSTSARLCVGTYWNRRGNLQLYLKENREKKRGDERLFMRLPEDLTLPHSSDSGGGEISTAAAQNRSDSPPPPPTC